jgi:hypothetical protein
MHWYGLTSCWCVYMYFPILLVLELENYVERPHPLPTEIVLLDTSLKWTVSSMQVCMYLYMDDASTLRYVCFCYAMSLRSKKLTV